MSRGASDLMWDILTELARLLDVNGGDEIIPAVKRMQAENAALRAPHVSSLSGPEKSIEEMQAAIAAAGWQWQEHIFNDGGPNCYVKFSQSRDPNVFLRTLGEDGYDPHSVGWGRFSREYCWRSAYQWIVEREIDK